jgi:hypothetical protein
VRLVVAEIAILRQRCKEFELPMSGFIPLDKRSLWAQGCRHDVGSFFLASLVFHS